MPKSEEDIAYYRRRIEACAEQAARAESLAARCAHETLARLYREKIAALRAEPLVDQRLDFSPSSERISP